MLKITSFETSFQQSWAKYTKMENDILLCEQEKNFIIIDIFAGWN